MHTDMTHRQFKLRFKASFYMYISQLVKTRDLHPGLFTIAILFPFKLFYWPTFSPLFFIVCFISLNLSSSLFIYYLSILVEVVLCLLTFRGDLVLLYLVSEHHS
jgi:hypothetical protein